MKGSLVEPIRLTDVSRWILAGVGHLSAQRAEFQAQVPSSHPLDTNLLVVASGIVEFAHGVARIATTRHRVLIGAIVAEFPVTISPSSVSQWLEGTDAFGLDTDTARFMRLFFQPALIAWALVSTGAWRA
jgi:uncharacterized membrane protein